MTSFATRFPKTLKALESARGDVFPAFAVGVHAQGHDFFGHGGCGSDSLFDLASLTKVMVTTTLVAAAEQRGLLSTDDPVRKYFPSFADPRVRLSHLLDHSSGFPWWLPLHAHFHEENGLGNFNPRTTPAEARVYYESEILKSHVPADFEKASVYSDLGFLLLGWLLENTAGAPLDALFQEWVVLPAELPSLQYLPVSPDVVPTENCPWRKRVLRGEVHDDNCFVLGGVAGHAGLFGDVRDTLRAGLLWLDAYKGRPSPLTHQTAEKFWKPSRVPGSTRSLGWDGRSREGSSTGRFMSSATRGHMGFTGTSLWIDPEKELVVTLLTNRVHPTRANDKIKAFRPLFHDTLLSELGFG